MATRSSERWQSLPGSFDALHGERLYPSSNAYGIPDLAPAPLAACPAWLAAYRQRVRSRKGLADGAVHFFLDDYRFESVWNRPFKALEHLSSYSKLLTPDFSLYRDWPHTLQLWNVYRNRWCGRFWQEQGFEVSPTIGWGGKASFEFCFLGVPEKSVVAVSTVGVKLEEPLAYTLFMDGFQEMVARLSPTRVLCYGKVPEACQTLVEVRSFPTRWEGIRKARKGAAWVT